MNVIIPLGIFSLLAWLFGRSKKDPKGEVIPGMPTVSRSKQLPPASEAASRNTVQSRPVTPIETPPHPQSSAARIKSPLPGVTDSQWQGLVLALADTDNPADIDAYGRIGPWRLHSNQLEPLGLTKNSRQIKVAGKSQWTSDWISPMTKARFATDRQAQYDALVKLMRDIIDPTVKIDPTKPTATIEGKKLSRSGMLSLILRAGPKGAIEWLQSPQQRKDFAYTTKIWRRANGIF